LEDLRWWIELGPGASVLIVKVRPDGSTATTYRGTVIDAGAPEGWLVAEAVWTRDPIELDGLLFNPGDRIHEYFSRSEYFNVFAVFSPDGTLRGWYANVTYPSWMGFEDSMPAIYWHDLYVDVIALPSGDAFVRDEDELEAAQSGFTDRHLVETILAARDELLRRFQSREFPFHDR
jgi:predicted RNA-binding protein associated with RNAse of E/G family